MFLLYALGIGLVLGLVLGGRPEGLSRLQFRLGWLVVAGLATQVVLFSDQVTASIGDLGPPIYVGSTLAVTAAVLVNYRVPGMAVVAAGAACNLAAIAANGGYMPASADAMAALGKLPKAIYSNSMVMPEPALPWLTDVFALPGWLPFANVFSIGDVLIAVGVAIVIVAAMRQPAPLVAR